MAEELKYGVSLGCSSNTKPEAKMFQVSGRVPLTSATIRRLLQCDQLRELRISDWSVTDEEFAQLEEMVKTNNWELFLTRKLVSS